MYQPTVLSAYLYCKNLNQYFTQELSHNYGVGYDLMLKMGWTPHFKNSAPVFVSLDKNYNTDSKFGLGFVCEENTKLDAEVSRSKIDTYILSF